MKSPLNRKYYLTRGEQIMQTEYPKIVAQMEKHKRVQGLMQYANKESLSKQHKLQKGNKATGVDEVTKAEYDKNLDENLGNLIEDMKKFSYRPQPVRRTYIPKDGSDKKRPLGIPAYEDKLVQGAMTKVLTAIYEPKFMDFSYGFRPGRSCHDAIKTLDKIIMREEVNFVVDADIKGFFDNVNHDWLIKFLEHDIDDKSFIRYVKRILRSGVMEQGKFTGSDKGTPQGGLISPILANVYLHYVLDLWFEKVIKRQCKGYAQIVRYADDFVCCFQYEEEATRFYGILKERLGKFGLEIAVDKSKIIKFGRNASRSRETFDFLGFTHINAVSRKGWYKLVHITSNKKLKVKVQVAKKWLLENIQLPIKQLIKKLNTKLVGHYRYYGISDNIDKMEKFKRIVERQLYCTLRQRGQKRKINWKKFLTMLRYNPIASPKIYVPLW